jgi:hypothetical protein
MTLLVPLEITRQDESNDIKKDNSDPSGPHLLSKESETLVTFGRQWWHTQVINDDFLLSPHKLK